MTKPKRFDDWPEEKKEEWRQKKREQDRKYHEANPEKTSNTVANIVKPI